MINNYELIIQMISINTPNKLYLRLYIGKLLVITKSTDTICIYVYRQNN